MMIYTEMLKHQDCWTRQASSREFVTTVAVIKAIQVLKIFHTDHQSKNVIIKILGQAVSNMLLKQDKALCHFQEANASFATV